MPYDAANAETVDGIDRLTDPAEAAEAVHEMEAISEVAAGRVAALGSVVRPPRGKQLTPAHLRELGQTDAFEGMDLGIRLKSAKRIAWEGYLAAAPEREREKRRAQEEASERYLQEWLDEFARDVVYRQRGLTARKRREVQRRAEMALEVWLELYEECRPDLIEDPEEREETERMMDGHRECWLEGDPP